ncbi:MAG TPA: HipA family kinase [Anaerolineae bacterium]|nr:HipA family kinase [Anaerolineae bacterium]
MLKHLTTTGYIAPLREGGSLPALAEADDRQLYVVKFRGAGQGRKALIAELIAGEIGHTLGLNVPELAIIELDPAFGKTERDPEIQDLLRASAGLNLGMAYLPGALMFDPLAEQSIDSKLASAIVWFDALVLNVDRTIKNPNLLFWREEMWLIDHGAALYFHHNWSGDYMARSRAPFALLGEHVLLPFARDLGQIDEKLAERLSPQRLEQIIAAIPDEWLIGEPAFEQTDDARRAYLQFLTERLRAPRQFFKR